MTAAPAARQVLRVLALLAREAEPLPAGHIARRLGLPRSTTYRLLTVLAEQGFVAHLEESRTFGLGIAAYEMGSAWQRQAPLQRLARPLIRRLVDETHENAHLAVLHGAEVLYLIEERAPRRPVLITDVGVRLPAVTTASGLALLAALPATQVRALFPDAAALRPWPGGPRTPVALRRLLVDVRARGWATEEGTVTAGLSSVGAAAHDHTGHPAAAVALTFATGSGRPPDEQEWVRRVRGTAQLLSRRLTGLG